MTFVEGLIIGLLIAIPVGPIGILCVERTLSKGKISGFISGMGAASADAFYGSVAAFGLTMISSFLMGHQTIIRIAGGTLLLYIGINSYLSASKTIGQKSESGGNLLSDYVSTLFLTIANPSTIISFAALFSGIGFVLSSKEPWSPIILVAGVFVGSAIWWLVLCLGIGIIKNHASHLSLCVINRLSGALIIGFALAILGYASFENYIL